MLAAIETTDRSLLQDKLRSVYGCSQYVAGYYLQWHQRFGCDVPDGE